MMTAYVKRIIQELLDMKGSQSLKTTALMDALVDELNRLDPRDFVPQVRYEFVENRSLYNLNIGSDIREVDWVESQLRNLLKILDTYAGASSHAECRSFDFMSDKDLRAIVERDYMELSVYLFPSEAWKSCIIMAGSVLEAVLYDQLTADANILSKAEASSKAPKRLSIEKGEWKLQHLIDVAAELGIIPLNRAASVDQVLRDYRNFVHPKKEIKAAHPCTEAEALMAKGALDGVCNHLGT
jgi:hypothetical protein